MWVGCPVIQERWQRSCPRLFSAIFLDHNNSFDSHRLPHQPQSFGLLGIWLLWLSGCLAELGPERGREAVSEGSIEFAIFEFGIFGLVFVLVSWVRVSWDSGLPRLRCCRPSYATPPLVNNAGLLAVRDVIRLTTGWLLEVRLRHPAFRELGVVGMANSQVGTAHCQVWILWLSGDLCKDGNALREVGVVDPGCACGLGLSGNSWWDSPWRSRASCWRARAKMAWAEMAWGWTGVLVWLEGAFSRTPGASLTWICGTEFEHYHSLGLNAG